MNQFGAVRSRYETKEQTAWRWSVTDLFDHSRAVYLWTFTLVDAMPSWWMGPTWAKLQDWVRERYGRALGCRVFEWHQDHGLHVHMLINVRIPVRQLRRFAARLGFGRINVKKANRGAGLYLAKYLGKDRGKLPHSGRQWARIGNLGCAKNAVKFESPSLTQRKTLAATYRRIGIEATQAMQMAERELELAEQDEITAVWRKANPDPF